MSKSLLKNIVVAVNGSQSSIHAATYGIILAKPQKVNLKFVYVVEKIFERLKLLKFV